MVNPNSVEAGKTVLNHVSVTSKMWKCGKSAYDNVTVFFSPFFVACYVKEKTRLNI